MKKYWVIIIAVILFGCTDENNKEENIQKEVIQEVDHNEKDIPNQELTRETVSAELLVAIDKLQSKTALKFTYEEVSHHHPELDPSEREYTMIYAPEKPFIYKKYSDNYFAGSYESYVTDPNVLYIKNEYGNNMWEYFNDEFVLESELSVVLGNFLSSIITQADTVELQQTEQGLLAMVTMANGDFTQVEQRYHAFGDMLDEIAITPNVLKQLDDSGENYTFNFTNIQAEVLLDANNEMIDYKLTLEYANGEEAYMIIEQHFEKINPETDYVLPDEIITW